MSRQEIITGPTHTTHIMISFSTANNITGALIFSYGLLLLFVPTLFFDNYIYRKGVWQRFIWATHTESSSVFVREHLLKGIALTWISWSALYFCASYMTDRTESSKFGRRLWIFANVMLWAMWIFLDRWVRKTGIYSIQAVFLNAMFVIGIFAMWTTLTLSSDAY